MAQMTLNAEIMSFGYSGMLASHKPEYQAEPAGRAREKSAAKSNFSPVRSLLVQLINPRV